MLEKKTVCLRRLASGRSEAIKFERFFRNDKVSIDSLILEEQARTKEVVSGRDILAIQDTTELNYQKHAGRVRDLGTVGNGKDAGFFMHPLLVLDANTGACLGSAAVQVWNRNKKASENHQKLAIEEKESYKWISTAEAGKKVLSSAAQVTYIGDRENDIYEFLDRVPDEHSHVITRVRCDRRLEDKKKLYAYLSEVESSGKLVIAVPPESRLNREGREAVLSIKYGEIEVKRPKNCSDKGASKLIRLYVVEAKEQDCPEGQEPVDWRLYTTHKVESVEDAKKVIKSYRYRWNIEQIFRTLKKQGLNLESSQIESGRHLMKLAVMSLSAAIQIMALVLARDGKTEQKPEDIFTKEEIMMLTMLLVTLEGKTEKQKNPYPKTNLSWASWIIARLGSWHGYTSSEGPPGPIVMSRGLNRFYDLYNGWKLSKGIVYAP